MVNKRRKMDELFAAMNDSGNTKEAEGNRFSNHPIKDAGKEIKDIYYKMLCLVVQYEEEMTEEQENYIKELFEGTGAEYGIEDCMDAAMEIEAKEFQNLLTLLKEQSWALNFAMDMLLLIQAGSGDKDLQQMALKFMDHLEIETEERDYLKALCESIQEKSVAKYIEAEDNRPESIMWERFAFYAQEFVEGIKQGVVINASNELCMICNYKEEKAAVELKQMTKDLTKIVKDKLTLSNVIRSKKVVLKNLKIEGFDQAGMFFNGCEKVLVENCEFIGGEDYLRCDSCEEVEFLGCYFHNFTTRVFDLNEVDEITFEKCNFEDCFVKKAPMIHAVDWDELYKESKSPDIKVNICFCVFKECGVETIMTVGYGGRISDFVSDLRSCKFINCGRKGSGLWSFSGEGEDIKIWDDVFLFEGIEAITKVFGNDMCGGNEKYLINKRGK